MTVTTNNSRNEYTSTAGQTTFTYDFKIYASTDLNVYQTLAGATADDTADIITAYSVTGVGNDGGGTVVLDTGASNGDKITIVSSIPFDRTTDYVVNGDFEPDTVNDDFDRVVSQVKQLEDRTTRTLVMQEAEQGVDYELPAPAAKELFRWNSAADGVEYVSTGDLGLEVTTSDWVVDRFTDGVDFTAGVTTQLTLSADPDNVKNTWVFFDGVTLEQDDYSVSGTTITFDSAIPGGTSVVEIRQNTVLPVTGSVTAASVTYDNSTSGLTATDVQNALDEIDSQVDTNVTNITELTTNQDDLVTLTGRPENSTTMGTYTGSTIPDNETVKENIQSLETAVEAVDSKVVIVHNSAITAATNIDVALDWTTYSKFEFVIEDSVPATDGADMRAIFSYDAGSTFYTSNYNNNGSGGQTYLKIGTADAVGNDTNEGQNVRFTINWADNLQMVMGETRTISRGTGAGFNQNEWLVNLLGASSGDPDLIRMYWSGGDWSANGNVFVYGYKRS